MPLLFLVHAHRNRKLEYVTHDEIILYADKTQNFESILTAYVLKYILEM